MEYAKIFPEPRCTSIAGTVFIVDLVQIFRCRFQWQIFRCRFQWQRFELGLEFYIQYQSQILAINLQSPQFKQTIKLNIKGLIFQSPNKYTIRIQLPGEKSTIKSHKTIKSKLLHYYSRVMVMTGSSFARAFTSQYQSPGVGWKRPSEQI